MPKQRPQSQMDEILVSVQPPAKVTQNQTGEVHVQTPGLSQNYQNDIVSIM